MMIEHKRRAAKVLAKQTAKTRKRIKDGLATVDVGERADVDIPELPKLPDLSGRFDTLRKLLADTVRILEFTAQTIKTLNVLMEDVHDTAPTLKCCCLVRTEARTPFAVRRYPVVFSTIAAEVAAGGTSLKSALARV